jgi:hypothetical protein
MIKTNIALREQELLNLKRRADKQSEYNIELVVHAQMPYTTKTTKCQESPHTC